MGNSWTRLSRTFHPTRLAPRPRRERDGTANRRQRPPGRTTSAGGTAISSANVAIEDRRRRQRDPVRLQTMTTQVCAPWTPLRPLTRVRCPAISPPSSDTGDLDPGTTINALTTPPTSSWLSSTARHTTTYSYTSDVSGCRDGLEYCSVDPVDYANGVRCPLRICGT